MIRTPLSPQATKPYAVWIALALPALAQLALLLYAVFSRLPYPYDLEWMEGGLLEHAARVTASQGIYVAPSAEFVPYLYTPLYTGVVAVLSQMFPLNYQLGRIVSILCMLAVIVMMARAIVIPTRRTERPAAWAGAAFAAGLFAAAYPWLEGWYDIVRADMLFTALAIGGMLTSRHFARSGYGASGHLQVAAAGAILALAFLAKQTGVFFVAAGGAVVLVLNWRRVPAFIAGAGFVGLGATWLFNRVSGGWFWEYVFTIPRAHQVSSERVMEAVANMLGQFPAIPLCTLVGLVAVGITAMATRKRPASSGPLLLWSFVYAVSVAVGAFGYGKHLAHYNHFLPAAVAGAIAAGASIPAVIGCVRTWGPHRSERTLDRRLVPSLVLAAALSWQCVVAWWSPSAFIPSQKDVDAGHALIARLADVNGPVFIPYHPWYAKLAGKAPSAHRMGLLDLAFAREAQPENRARWRVANIAESIREHAFTLIVLDNRELSGEFPGLEIAYRLDEYLATTPRLFAGAGRAHGSATLLPESIWIPSKAVVPPKEVTVLDNFEAGKYQKFSTSGKAWGGAPASRPLAAQGKTPQQGPVRGFRGRYFATSFHGGDPATGTLVSRSFLVDCTRITFRLSGGSSPRLRAELVVGDDVVRSATGRNSDQMDEITWSTTAYQGQQARIRFVDQATGPWGHLNADEVWLWKDETVQAEPAPPPRSPFEDTR